MYNKITYNLKVKGHADSYYQVHLLQFLSVPSLALQYKLRIQHDQEQKIFVQWLCRDSNGSTCCRRVSQLTHQQQHKSNSNCTNLTIFKHSQNDHTDLLSKRQNNISTLCMDSRLPMQGTEYIILRCSCSIPVNLQTVTSSKHPNS